MLSSELILEKCKTDSLKNVININLWGNELKDVSILKECLNVEVISLSANYITSLKSFSYCKNLKELYLRKNQIAGLDEINHLKSNSKLKILWLGENPICKVPNYRTQVIFHLPQLSKLDNITITQIERDESALLLSSTKSVSPNKTSYKAKFLVDDVNYKEVAMKNIINESVNNMNKTGTRENFNVRNSNNISESTDLGKRNPSSNNLPIVSEDIPMKSSYSNNFPNNFETNKNNPFNEYAHRNNKILNYNPSYANMLKDNSSNANTNKYDHAETIKNFNDQRYVSPQQTNKSKNFEQTVYEDPAYNDFYYSNSNFTNGTIHENNAKKKFSNVDYSDNKIHYNSINSNISNLNQSNQTQYKNNNNNTGKEYLFQGDSTFTLKDKDGNNNNQTIDNRNNRPNTPNSNVVIAVKSLLYYLKISDLLYLRKLIEDRNNA